ncbi:MAG: hypothetical protein GY743_19420 [Planctomycetaceae bacterium]|nr:hypothetical protein [Planctomycetaceae bacterium]
MLRKLPLGLIWCCALWALPSVVAQDRNYVELEILAEQGTLISSGQKWMEALSEAGADNVRLGQTNRSKRIGIDKRESSGGRSSYTITGKINSRNQLLLPAGRYSLRETAKIKAYVESIRADGAEVALSPKMAFGLTAKQLVDLHKTLKPIYNKPTLGTTPKQILDAVQRNCKTPIVIDPSAREALQGDYTVEDELQGLSQGTVLAAALRPLGLVAAPSREQGKATKIVITDTRRVEEHWPIGWPPKSRNSQSFPQLYERIPVNIRNYTLSATLKAIQGAMKAPFVYDYNSLARSGLDVEKVRINLEAEKMSYLLILNRIVGQVRPRIQYEVRADENGKPFIWFSSR